MQYGGHGQQHGRNPQQGQQREQENVLNELKERLRRSDISQLDDREVFHPEGYAKKLAEKLDTKTVQLRRIYQEFKVLNDLAKEGSLDKIKPRLYRLYAIVEYQAQRNVIGGNFKELVHSILNNIERRLSNDTQTAVKNLQRAYDLMMAIVAYSKQRGG